MKRVLIVCFAIAAFAGPLFAADTCFDRMDADNNGTIGKEEFTRSAEIKFKTYDRDNDGYISEQEFGATPERWSSKEFSDIDRDNNKKISLKEFREAAIKAFNSYDLNYSGTLTEEEFYAKRAYPQIRIYF